MLPADDPDHGEGVQVLAVERNGLRRYAVAEIMRNGETATLGPWVLESDVPSGWLLELLEEGHSDRAPAVEPRPLERISASDFQHLAGPNPAQATEFRDSVEIHDQLGDLMAGQVQKDADRDPQAIFMALESILRMIVKDMGSPKGIGEFARFLRDHPDKFPMFSTVPDGVPSMQQVRRCNATLYRFVSEKRQAGHTPSAIFGAFVNMYMFIGAQAIGAVNLADRIENWAPEHLAKLREVGLRSSFEEGATPARGLGKKFPPARGRSPGRRRPSAFAPRCRLGCGNNLQSVARCAKIRASIDFPKAWLISCP
jgi:hypothetical protein